VSAESIDGYTASAQAYDPATDTWTDLAPLPAPRARGTAVGLTDGSALLIGGAHSFDDVFGACNEAVGLADVTRFLP
jgi:hypothetical protein